MKTDSSDMPDTLDAPDASPELDGARALAALLAAESARPANPSPDPASNPSSHSPDPADAPRSEEPRAEEHPPAEEPLRVLAGGLARQAARMFGAGLLREADVVALLRRGAELGKEADAREWASLMRVFTTTGTLYLKLLSTRALEHERASDESAVPLTLDERRERLLAILDSRGPGAGSGTLGTGAGPAEDAARAPG